MSIWKQDKIQWKLIEESEERYDLKRLGDNLKYIRKNIKRINRAEAGKAIGYNENTIKNVENGDSNTKIQTLIALSEYYGYDIDSLFGLYDANQYDIHYICEETGLSEKAVQSLKQMKKKMYMTPLINMLLSSPSLIDHIIQYIRISYDQNVFITDKQNRKSKNEIPSDKIITIGDKELSADIIKRAVLDDIRDDLETLTKKFSTWRENFISD